MTGLTLFTWIGLLLGCLGLALVVYPVLWRMIKEVIERKANDRLVANLLPIAKGTYLILMLPVVGYSLYAHLTVLTEEPSRTFIRGFYGYAVFINAISWVFIYTTLVQRAVEWYQQRNKRH